MGLPSHVRRVREATIPSPWRGRPFVPDGAAVLESRRTDAPGLVFEVAGPRERLAFDATARCAILTAGGLSPGLNDVVRGLVLSLWHGYGVRAIHGIAHGFEGLVAGSPRMRPLAPADVADIHHGGGTILGTSRVRHDLAVAARRLRDADVQALFAIGGDGTLRGARLLVDELAALGHACAVVAIPKTIDNDILHCSRTFGYATAVEEAARAITCAHAEARSHRDGVTVVQLMGRESGFIAAGATLACPDVNFCLVPESPFEIGGSQGLAEALAARLEARGHAVIVVAEGAGATLFSSDEQRVDASGNVKLPAVGPRLVSELDAALRAAGREPTIKLIDPSYMIRSVVACAEDRILCLELAQAAVHAALAGCTGIMVSNLGDDHAHVPLDAACAGRKHLDPRGATWQAVLAATGQPPLRA